MKDRESARDLAETMVEIGAAHDTVVRALITDMSQPLGREVGNAGEIVESLDVLRGSGPADLVELILRLGVEMLVMGGVDDDPAAARKRLEATIGDGSALAKFEEVVEAQGGDVAALHDPGLLPNAPHEDVIAASHAGVVTRCDALDLGVAAVRLGAGRAFMEEEIDLGVGFSVCVKVGDQVAKGDPLVRIRWRDRARFDSARPLAERAIVVGDGPAKPPDLILQVVS